MCFNVVVNFMYYVLWLLNFYDLDLYVGWFEIRRGFTDYRVIRA
jgi:hypothetical protein